MLYVLPKSSTLLLMESLEAGDVEAEVLAGKEEDLIASHLARPLQFRR